MSSYLTSMRTDVAFIFESGCKVTTFFELCKFMMIESHFMKYFLSLFRCEKAAGIHDKGCKEESAVVPQAPAERGSEKTGLQNPIEQIA